MTAIEDLETTFSEARLAVPPVPTSLAPSLVRRDEWLYSTREIDRMDSYMLAPYLQEALAGPIDDYVAVTHGGHGVNSYSLNYLLVLSPLVVMTQVGWGGAYMDKEVQRVRWADEVNQITTLLDAAAGLTEDEIGGRLMIATSDFRQLSSWALIAPGSTNGIGSLSPASESGPSLMHSDGSTSIDPSDAASPSRSLPTRSVMVTTDLRRRARRRRDNDVREPILG